MSEAIQVILFYLLSTLYLNCVLMPLDYWGELPLFMTGHLLGLIVNGLCIVARNERQLSSLSHANAGVRLVIWVPPHMVKYMSWVHP